MARHNLFLVLLLFVAVLFFGFWAKLASASGYFGYTLDIDRRATTADAARILVHNFLSAEDVAQKLGITAPSLPKILPWKIRTIMDCGHCMLFPAFAKIGSREMSINGMNSSPETRQLFQRGWTMPRSGAWFEKKEFANEPLETEWHLMKLDVQNEGVALKASLQSLPRNQKIARANVYLWALLLTGVDKRGRAWYTDDPFFGNPPKVVVIRAKGKWIDLDQSTYLRLDGVGILPEIKPDFRH